MRHVAPTRQRTLTHDLKARQVERLSPILFQLKLTWPTAAAPLPVMCPTDEPIPPKRRNVFVNDRQPSVTQDPAHFVQHEARIMRVMQHVTKEHCVETLIANREVPAVVGKIVDSSSGAGADIESDDSRSEYGVQVMRDKSVAATNVEYVGARRKYASYFKRHVVGAAHLATPVHAPEATLNRCE